MKKKGNNILIATVTICLLLFSFKIIIQDSSIVGTWISENDTNWKINFDSNGNSIWFYNNSQTDTYVYSLNNSSPKCNNNVLVNSKTNYLTLTNNSDINDKICYEVYSISSSKLTLREINSSSLLIFDKE
ncbi:hypothetical protein [uncultured Flavobacterium sp.]|uniref:hypothetical protein n=1 Tax=uncultured Flavobacterium sp. TaxID=165435 RepID=UPI002623314E|nr:hypothetical protein [uncultured Flavobacterium sp.]